MSSSMSKPGSSSSDPKKAKQDVSSKSKGKVGDWVRHISSSGKEYYFNVTTHASQWEKPRDWLEYEKRYGPVPNQPSSSSSKPNSQHHQQLQHHQQQQQSSSSSVADRNTSERERERYHHHHHYPNNTSTSNSSSAVAHSSSSSYGSQRDYLSSSSSHGSMLTHQHVQMHTAAHAAHHHHSSSSSSHAMGSRSQSDMMHHGHGSGVSSSAGVSTSGGHGSQQQQRLHNLPEGFHLRHSSSSSSAAAAIRDSRKPSEDLQTEDMDISPLEDSNSPVSTDSKSLGAAPSSSSSTIRDSHQQYQHHHQQQQQQHQHLQRNNSHLEQQIGGRMMLSGNSATGNNGYSARDRDRDRILRERDNRDSPRRDRGRTRDRPDHRDRERERDRSRSKLRDERSRSPWDKDGTPERHTGGEMTSGGGLGSLATLSALNQPDTETPPLPASLAQYYREDLIAHVKDLPGENLERQANKLSDEIMTTGAIQLSKVSTELKMARSLVRLTDIQATLQEQRILFLRQQIRNLEESERDNSAMLGVETGDT